jgi:gliding motility-associated-like protein
VEVQNGTCPATTSGIFTISVSGVSVGGSLNGPNAQQCAGTNSGTLTLTGFTGSILKWQSSTDNFATSQNISFTSFINNFNNLTTTTSFNVVVQNGACPAATSGVFTVSVVGLSVGGNLSGANGQLCANSNNGTLTLSGYNGNIVDWESSTDNFLTVNSIVNSSPIYSFSNLATSTSFRVNVASGSCAPAISTIQTINIVPSSVGGTVSGPTGTYCSGSNAGTLTLSGYVGNILDWESSTDNFASIIVPLNQSGSTLDFTNLSIPTSFRVVIQNGSCPTVNSNVFLINIPSANAGVLTGPTNAFCTTGNSGTLSLSGNTNPIIRWESSTDNVTYTAINNTSSTYSFNQLPNTTYYRVVEQNNQCPIITSNLFTITVTSPPVAGVLTGGSTLADGPNSGTLQLNNYSGNIIRWEESSDSLMTVVTPIVNTTPQQNYSNLTVTTYYRAVVNTSGCPAVYSNVTGVILSKLVIYTGFSPDGDEKNDTWEIDNILLYPNNKVKVYNRWGNLVYQESGYDNKLKVWDGHSNTGFVLGNQTLPEGTYYYVISISGFPDMSGYLLLNK